MKKETKSMVYGILGGILILGFVLRTFQEPNLGFYPWHQTEAVSFNIIRVVLLIVGIYLIKLSRKLNS